MSEETVTSCLQRIAEHHDRMVGELEKVYKERDEALMDRANGDMATMTVNHYERILRERDEAIKKIQRQAERICQLEGATNHAGGTPLLIALRERDEARARRDEARAEQHDRMVGELEKVYAERDEAREQNAKLRDIAGGLAAALERLDALYRSEQDPEAPMPRPDWLRRPLQMLDAELDKEESAK